MIVVVFETWPADGKIQTYLEMGKSLHSRLDGVDGFISVERFQSVADPSKLVALSFWRGGCFAQRFKSPCGADRQPA